MRRYPDLALSGVTIHTEAQVHIAAGTFRAAGCLGYEFHNAGTEAVGLYSDVFANRQRTIPAGGIFAPPVDLWITCDDVIPFTFAGGGTPRLEIVKSMVIQTTDGA